MKLFDQLRALIGRLKGNGGKIAVLGSVHLFSDLYIDKEANKQFLEQIIEYLTETKAAVVLDDHDLEVGLDLHDLFVPFFSNFALLCGEYSTLAMN